VHRRGEHQERRQVATAPHLLAPRREDGVGDAGPAEHVLDPLGVTPSTAFFTDCPPTYFVKDGPGSQGERIRTVYLPFAARVGLEQADLPSRPGPQELVRRSTTEEASILLDQLAGSHAPRIVTLGQEAADVLAAIAGAEQVTLVADPG
jgi:hypothetical protein